MIFAVKALENKIVIQGTQVKVSGGIVTGPMQKQLKHKKWLMSINALSKKEFGDEVSEWVAGGLTDGNRTAKFVPTLDALGVESMMNIQIMNLLIWIQQYLELAALL